jgi:hypothetical protein
VPVFLAADERWTLAPRIILYAVALDSDLSDEPVQRGHHHPFMPRSTSRPRRLTRRRARPSLRSPGAFLQKGPSSRRAKRHVVLAQGPRACTTLKHELVCRISNCVYRQIHRQFIQLIDMKVVCKLFNALCIPLHLCLPSCDRLIENVSNK